MLDRVRTELGLDIDVVEATATGSLEPGAAPAEPIFREPEFRAAALGVLREGRTRLVSLGNRRYTLTPVRAPRAMSPVALLVIRLAEDGGPAAMSIEALEPWIELLRGAIEADLTSREEIRAERQHARSMQGALRFVRYLASASSERELAEAVIHAVAIWFDADGRMYRREASGDYVIYASLPAAQVSPEPLRLGDLPPTVPPSPLRLSDLSDVRAALGTREGVLVPIPAAASVDWVLAVLGTVPAEAESALDVLARVLGAQLERLSLRERERHRARFEAIVSSADRAPELTALDLLRELVAQTGGEGAALWLQQRAGVRRLGSVGTHIAGEGPWRANDVLATPARQVRSIGLGADRLGRLEVVASAAQAFDVKAGAVIDACEAVLRVWLSAVGRPAQELTLPSDAALADFAGRIEEELVRARRFDHNLALVVLEANGRPARREQLERLIGVLRRELRGSDVLGTLGAHRVAALLVETDASGVGTVVRRLRERLGHLMPELELSNLLLGQAALSAECPTADALLLRAAVNAEAITLPN